MTPALPDRPTGRPTARPPDQRVPQAVEPTRRSAPAAYHRFVAIGDSWTEGVGDPDPSRPNGWRGWADRVAEALAAELPDLAGRSDPEGFGYANLAIRGRTVEEILDEQLEPALALHPDLVTIQGAGNDLLHLRVDIDELVRLLDDATARVTATGAMVVLFTHGAAASGPFSTLRGRIAVFNELLREVVDARGAVLVDNWRVRDARDPRYWDTDRVHLSPLGHERAAAHVLHTLGRGPALAPLPEPPAGSSSTATRLRDDAEWLRTFVAPWIHRRLTGRSLGDGVRPKRPTLDVI